MSIYFDIVELAKQCPDLTISVKVGDLVEANKKLVKDVRSLLEEQIKEDQEEKYLSPDEVAKMLDVTKPTLWRWRKLEYLVPSRIGGKVRYRQSEVKRVMNKKPQYQ